MRNGRPIGKWADFAKKIGQLRLGKKWWHDTNPRIRSKSHGGWQILLCLRGPNASRLVTEVNAVRKHHLSNDEPRRLVDHPGLSFQQVTFVKNPAIVGYFAK